MAPQVLPRCRQCLALLVTLPFLLVLISFLVSPSHSNSVENVEGTLAHRQLLSTSSSKEPMRVLYIVTTLAEYNTGDRATERGSDRLQETLIPVVRDGVESMLQYGYSVDVFLVCHFEMRPERFQLVRDSLPESVQLDYWDDATPMGYEPEADKIRYMTRALARQHRFVIKDNFLEYDFFVNFEDDMLIKGHHIQHFLRMTNELDRLWDLAPDDLPGNPSRKQADSLFYGPMTKKMLARTFPGFIRVEALLDEEHYGTQTKLEPVPVDLGFDGVERHVNASYCCHLSDKAASETRPASPPTDKLFLWETGVLALGVRQMPQPSFLDWVVLQRGPRANDLEINEHIPDFSAIQSGYYDKGTRRPGNTDYGFINNMGGWMATRKQIWRWHTEICPGGYLPPFDPPHYNKDGVDLRNVEYWSGGLHLVTYRHACNMQRIISLDPDHFSQQLLYHSANNKQRQLQGKKERKFVKVDNFLGQLNAVRKKAKIAMQEATGQH